MKSYAHNRLLELDALRGIAAVMVMLFHFSHPFAQELGWEFEIGITGVDIFFMISGFVIFLSILSTESWNKFVLFRFSRLYPTYWICVLITGTFIFVCEPASFHSSNVITNLTMFPSYFRTEDLDGSYWTLLVELLFYIWILLIYLYHKMEHIVLIGVLCTIGILCFHHFGAYYPTVYQFALQKIQLINHFPLFLSGIVFYKMYTQSVTRSHVLVLLFCLCSAIYLSNKGGRTMYILQQKEHITLLIAYHLLFLLFILKKLKFIAIPPLLFLGRISYSLYLLHQYIGLQFIQFFRTFFFLDIYSSIVLAILICVYMAELVTRYIEIPSIQYIRNSYKRRQLFT